MRKCHRTTEHPLIPLAQLMFQVRTESNVKLALPHNISQPNIFGLKKMVFP